MNSAFGELHSEHIPPSLTSTSSVESLQGSSIDQLYLTILDAYAIKCKESWPRGPSFSGLNKIKALLP